MDEQSKEFGVKISKVSVVVLLMLIGVMVLEVNYFKSKTDGNNTMIEEPEQQKPVEVNLTKVREREDRKILLTVDAYQEGYKDGCPESASMRKSDPVGSLYERSYILGFEKARKVCDAKRKSQRESQIEKENFQKGEGDGCSTAKGKPVQNKSLYLQKSAYYKGWESGYKACKKKVIEKEAVEEKAASPKNSVSRIDRHSQEYREAYQDACEAMEGRGFRDEDLYLRSRNYRAGWTEGRKRCNSKRETVKRKSLHTRSYFDRGYRDGCASSEGYFRKDRYIYARHRSYRDGWSLGREECGRGNRIERLPPPPVPFAPFGF